MCDLTPMANGYISWKTIRCVTEALIKNRYNIADQDYGNFGSNYDEKMRRMTSAHYTIVTRKRTVEEIDKDAYR